jgi:hypothetical protein
MQYETSRSALVIECCYSKSREPLWLSVHQLGASRMSDRLRVLGEEILHEQGSFRRLRQYVAGWHPHLGTLHFGWSGRETIIERDVILPARQLRISAYLRDAGGADGK